MRLFPYALALLAGTALLAACNEIPDEPGQPYDLTGRYAISSIITAAHPIAMYTKDGPVSDPAAVTRFLARRPTLSTQGYFSTTNAVRSGTGTTTLTFRANNRATLLSVAPTYTDSVRLEVTDRRATYFLLHHLDSTTLYTTAAQTACTHLDALMPYVRGTDWGRRCRAMPPATGYSQQCRVRLVRVMGARDGKLYIPYYSWLVQTSGCSAAVGGDWNTFNPGLVSYLVPGDTVVVQEREVALNR